MPKCRAVRLLVLSISWVVLAAPIAVTLSAAPNGEATRLLRSPTVSQAQVAFAHANNIWVVEGSGRRCAPVDELSGRDDESALLT